MARTIGPVCGSANRWYLSSGSNIYPYGGVPVVHLPASCCVRFTARIFFEMSLAYASFAKFFSWIEMSASSRNESKRSVTEIKRTPILGKICSIYSPFSIIFRPRRDKSLTITQVTLPARMSFIIRANSGRTKLTPEISSSQ